MHLDTGQGTHHKCLKCVEESLCLYAVQLVEFDPDPHVPLFGVHGDRDELIR